MTAPRTLQPSFAKGEITPLLYPRVDLSAYQTGLARLLNAIVLPTGGVARRPGMAHVGYPRRNTGAACPVRLIPFIYNSEDAMMIEITAGAARLWGSTPERLPDDQTQWTLPYAESDLRDICYAQSGNVVFLAHPAHPVYMLRRKKLANGRPTLDVSPLEYRNGPWLSELPPEGISFRVYGSQRAVSALPAMRQTWRSNISTTEDYFTVDMVGKLLELNFATGMKTLTTYTGTDGAWHVSDTIEVGGQYHIQTHGSWKGQVVLERSYDGGTTWVDAVSMYDRTDPGAQGNWDISRVEDEKNVLYRMKSKQDNGQAVPYTLSVSSFTKTYIYKITSITSARLAVGEWQIDRNEVATAPPFGTTMDTRLGAWAGVDGYPGIITFYQGRMVLAGSRGEPQTIWMSRVDDFADYGTSMEIQDDDAVNITLSSPDADGIVGLDAMDDLMVRTTSSEWRVKGAGDYGAITPTSIVAHRQASEIGSARMRGVIVSGGSVFVQNHRRSVYALGYDLSSDGYRGNELSILSSHLFRGRQIIQMAWQQEPDKVMWFALSDGTMVSCSFDPTQQMNAWARHETQGTVGDIAVIPNNAHDELWLAVKRDDNWRIERMTERDSNTSVYTDGGRSYETCIRTLRINYSGEGSVISKQKLNARCIVYTYGSREAYISPANDRDRAKIIKWQSTETMNETDVQLDNGFRKDAGIEIWTSAPSPLMVLAISPTLTAGG